MNQLKELFDQLKDTLIVRWEQFQETDSYISLKDRYDNLSLRNQKLAIFSVFFVVFIFIFMIPFSWYSESGDYISQFNSTRNTIQELLSISQEVKSLPPKSEPLTSSDLKSRVEKILAEKGLTKEQIISVIEGQFTNTAGSFLIPAQILAAGVDVRLKKLNLTQIVDFNYEFDRISSAVKVLNMDVNANKDDSHYYDVGYRVASFSVNDASEKQQNNKKPTHGGVTK